MSSTTLLSLIGRVTIIFMMVIPLGRAQQTAISTLFSNHAVLQRDQPITIWGQGAPNAQLQVQLGDDRREVRVSEAGDWEVIFEARSPGKPLTLDVIAPDTTLHRRDILVGDVWLCSGQSNMEWTVAASNDAAREMSNANDALIRHFKVPHAFSYVPDDSLPGGPWQRASPETVGNFSAVGYFFAREVRSHHNVPIGLLNASWGGSRIEPWMRAELLGYDPERLAAELKNESERQAEERRTELQKKIGPLPKEDAGLLDENAVWADPQLDDSDWKKITLPNLWESQGYLGLDGVVWFRRSLRLSEEEAAGEATLSLAKIDDADMTWVNGVLVGSTNVYNEDRLYQVPAKVLRPDRNVVTVRVEDTGGGGGVYGADSKMLLQTATNRHSLAGEWKLKVGEVSHVEQAMAVRHTPTLLYNKMIHPMLRFPIAGALWYQGESNASLDQAHGYRDLFKQMISDWRALWGIGDFPFLWVQLANFMAADDQPAESGWALLRESQSDALQLPQTAEAV
ncbi:MAG: sialate O-acetylesterase, partial [Saprospiraceae bacterium]|nr:sialate O-acetylesterase [Saprospiraceae bacterium]